MDRVIFCRVCGCVEKKENKIKEEKKSDGNSIVFRFRSFVRSYMYLINGIKNEIQTYCNNTFFPC